MSTLSEYLNQKRAALDVLKARALEPDAGPRPIAARVTAEGRSGVRRIRIRDFQVISDSGPDFAGYDLGPSSPELQLGVLGSCLTHIFLIKAAELGVPLDSLSVEIQGQIDPRANKPGFESIPVHPHAITYRVHVSSPAGEAEIAAVHEAVERACPILSLLKNPQTITGTVEHSRSAPAALEAVA